jgi:hypothetical protein
MAKDATRDKPEASFPVLVARLCCGIATERAIAKHPAFRRADCGSAFRPTHSHARQAGVDGEDGSVRLGVSRSDRLKNQLFDQQRDNTSEIVRCFICRLTLTGLARRSGLFLQIEIKISDL